MSNTNSSNKAAVPEAKGALNRFKFEVASELGVPLERWLQRKSDFQTERLRRRLYGQKNDRSPGASDVQRISERSDVKSTL